MNKITHIVYNDYPEQPYISPERDLTLWEKSPEIFPYKKVEKKQMIRLTEGILPGHIIMLWRIGFHNYTNKSVIPQYFEYKYGVDGKETIETLIKLGYAVECDGKNSLNVLNSDQIKKILKANNLKANGKKDELISRVIENIPEDVIEKSFSLRRYDITKTGKQLLEKYDSIIQKHGPKM